MYDLNFLETQVAARVGEGSRMNHIRSVRDECARMAGLFGMNPAEKHDLCAAALLHDVTKPLDAAGQTALAAELGITLTQDDLDSPAVLHALTGAALSARDFPGYANPEVCRAIAAHTTGEAGMSLAGKLLFLADFIEPGRPYESCRSVRAAFYDGMESENREARLKRLDRTLIRVFDLTIGHLIAKREKIHPKTVISRNFLL